MTERQFVFGIDPSTNTGLVIVEHLPSGPRTHLRTEIYGKGKGLERAGLIAEQVGRLLAEYPPLICGIEGYGFGNKFTLVTLVEIGTLIRQQLLSYRVPYLEVPPTALKKFVTGSGAAKKDGMLLAAFKRWGFEGSHDEVDAFGLAMVAGAHVGLWPASNQAQGQVLEVLGKKSIDKRTKQVRLGSIGTASSSTGPL